MLLLLSVSVLLLPFAVAAAAAADDDDDDDDDYDLIGCCISGCVWFDQCTCFFAASPTDTPSQDPTNPCSTRVLE